MLQQARDELKSLKLESASAKAKQKEYVDYLQDKLTKHREEKKSWASEATELRGEVIEAKVRERHPQEGLGVVADEPCSFHSCGWGSLEDG